MGENMNALFSLMASPAGRLLRITAGGALVFLGLLGLDGKSDYLLTVTGFVPLLTGVLNICLLAPLLGFPLRGPVVRSTNNG